MRTIPEFLEAFHQYATSQILEALVVRKLSDQGVSLSARERRLLATQLQRGDGTVRLRRWDLRWWKHQHVVFEPTAADVEWVENAYKKAMEKAPNAFSQATEDFAAAVLRDLRRKWKAESRAQKRDIRGFRRRHRAAWKEPFEKLRMQIAISREVGGIITNDLKDSEGAATRASLIEVMGRLHARGCQVAEEIACLLEGGFADGAIARWRCLHEVVVFAKLIATHGEPLAERFVAYEAVDAAASAKIYQECAPVLGFELLEDSEMRAIGAACDQAVAKYGPHFGNPQYGWAADALGMKSPQFRHLEAAAGVGHLRSYYKFASHNVHVDPNGVFYRLGLLDEPGVWLAGPSNIGLTDPGQCTAQSLALLLAAHGSLDLTVDVIAAVQIANRLVPEIAEAFAVAEGAITG